MPHAWTGAVLITVAATTTAVPQDLPATSRSPLGEAIRATLIASPGLLSGLTTAPQTPVDLYAEEIDRDLTALQRAAPLLFDAARPGIGPAEAPTRIALFSRESCAACATARAELQALATRMGFRATLFDMDRDADLAHDLGLDTAPSYVLPDKMLRGAMPSVVLKRYLSE